MHDRLTRATLALACAALAGCSGGGAPPAAPASVEPVAPPQPVATVRATAPPGGTAPAAAASAPCASGTPAVDGMVANIDDATTIRDRGAAIAAYAKRYCIGTIFLNVPYGDLTYLVQRDPPTVAALDAMFAAADVYMLAGHLEWLDTPGTIPPAAAQLTQTIGPMYPAFKGIVYDIEPQAYGSWQSDRQGTITRYMTLLRTLFSGTRPATYGRTLVFAPFYFATQKSDGGAATPSLLEEVESMPQVSGTFLAVYATPAARQLQLARAALAQLRKPFWIASTTDEASDTASTYFDASMAAFTTQMGALRAGAAAANAGLLGTAVNAWNTDGTSLQTVMQQP